MVTAYTSLNTEKVISNLKSLALNPIEITHFRQTLPGLEHMIQSQWDAAVKQYSCGEFSLSPQLWMVSIICKVSGQG